MDLTKINGSSLIARTPELIAAEINSIKTQTRQIMLNSSIEIGRRLVEAKSLMEHGEWGEWLESSVEYSKSTANNLMRIFDAYGADQMTLLLDSNAKNEIFGSLSYTQAVALLGLPEGEREAFITEHDMDSMSTRELQQAIKERDEALQEKNNIETERDFLLDQLKQEHDSSLQKIQDLEREKDDSDARIHELMKELEDSTLDPESKDTLQKQLEQEKQFSAEKENELVEKDKQLQKLKKDMESELFKSKKLVKDLEKQLKDLQDYPPQAPAPAGASEEEIERIREETSAEFNKKFNDLQVEKDRAEQKIKELEIKATQQNPAALKYKVYFDELQQLFKNLLGTLSELKASDEEIHEKYKKATAALISKMSECL